MEKNKIIGIDVGGSTTKIVGFDLSGDSARLLSPIFVKADDPITSIYGAFGRFTLENGIALPEIDSVLMTGVGASHISEPIYSLRCENVNEFKSTGLGGLYLSGLSEAIVVSMGTGTAMIHAKKTDSGTEITYLGGTGVGGGTLVGLSRQMLGIDDISHLAELCEGGDLNLVDLRIKNLSKKKTYENINDELTAANFGNKLSTNIIAGKVSQSKVPKNMKNTLKSCDFHRNVKKLIKKTRNLSISGLKSGGDCWTRTSDLLRVKQAL